MKYLGINLTKYLQDLHEENYKTLMKDIQEVHKWRGILCSWIGKTQYSKDASVSNLVYRFYIILIKITASYFVDINTLVLKFTQRIERPKITNSISNEEYKVRELTLSNFKIYYKATAIKTVWYSQKNRYLNGTE